MRKLIVLLAVAMVGIGVPAATAGATPLPDLVCGQPITSNMRLREDLTCPFGFAVQGSSPVVVDLGGHTLKADEGPVISTITATPLTVRNGTIDGTLAFDSGGFTSIVTVRNVHVTDFVTLFGSGGTVRNSVIDGAVETSGQVDTVTRDVIRGGIIGDDGSSGGTRTITHNIIVGGIQEVDAFSHLDLSGQITDNFVAGSPGAGISMGGLDEHSFLIARNLVIGNAGDGIAIGVARPSSTGAQVTITRNVAVDNAGHGINVEPTLNTVIDGGHNRAIGNDTEPQCIGIACKA